MLPALLCHVIPAILQQKKAKTAKRGSKYSRDLDKLSKQEQRMMKNRESAARSRQRRQQHTTELEETNAQLLAEVASLRVQVCVRVRVCVQCFEFKYLSAPSHLQGQSVLMLFMCTTTCWHQDASWCLGITE